MKFREHRGELSEAMKTVREFETRPALVAHIAEIYSYRTVTDDMITIEPYGFDERIGWDTHIVCVDGVAIGFTDGKI